MNVHLCLMPAISRYLTKLSRGTKRIVTRSFLPYGRTTRGHCCTPVVPVDARKCFYSGPVTLPGYLAHERRAAADRHVLPHNSFRRDGQLGWVSRKARDKHMSEHVNKPPAAGSPASARSGPKSPNWVAGALASGHSERGSRSPSNAGARPSSAGPSNPGAPPYARGRPLSRGTDANYLGGAAATQQLGRVSRSVSRSRSPPNSAGASGQAQTSSHGGPLDKSKGPAYSTRLPSPYTTLPALPHSASSTGVTPQATSRSPPFVVLVRPGVPANSSRPPSLPGSSAQVSTSVAMSAASRRGRSTSSDSSGASKPRAKRTQMQSPDRSAMTAAQRYEYDKRRAEDILRTLG